MLIRLGVVLICIGLMMGDSDSLVAPLVVIGIGAALVAVGRRLEGEKEVQNLSR